MLQCCAYFNLPIILSSIHLRLVLWAYETAVGDKVSMLTHTYHGGTLISGHLQSPD